MTLTRMGTQDPFDLRGQEQAAAERDAQARAAARVEAEDLKWLMKNRQGRRIAHRLLDRAGVFRLSFDMHNGVMSFNEGRRSEGLRLMSLLLEHCPDRYAEMLTEARKHDDRNHGAADRTDPGRSDGRHHCGHAAGNQHEHCARACRYRWRSRRRAWRHHAPGHRGRRQASQRG
jgi:hypothetical protein